MDTALADKKALKVQNQELLKAFKTHSPITDLVKRRCQFVDDLLRSAWAKIACADLPIALIAVGGYGRGELHPHSDIDILFLLDQELNADIKQILSQFITYLWDTGLEVGHSVRTLNETIILGKQDITIATNLLESRLLIGKKQLYENLYASVRSNHFWPSDLFFLAKRQEQDERHAKASAFDLEPNIKTCPGGLRDIQTITWVAMRHFNAANLKELVDYQFLDADELEELLESQYFLWDLRFALHIVAKRDENRLLFDLQPQVAKIMGFKDSAGVLAVEQMMKRYYRTIRRVIELNEMLLQLFKRAAIPDSEALTLLPIDEKFQCRGRFIESLDEHAFDKPENILQLFMTIAENEQIQSIFAPTLRALRQARRTQLEPLMNHSKCRQLFMAILRHPNSINALSLMHKHGILSAYLPAWRNIEGQMQFDLFHVYTVDEHTHKILKIISKFDSPECENEFPLSSKLIKQLPEKGLLVLAAIFHDIAKGRGGDHSLLGAQDVEEFCQLHEINHDDSQLVIWLVKHHLSMSMTAQRQDISDPDVVNKFADRVKDNHHLNYLYCLTVADICATNDKLWNSWRGSLLRELYFSTQRALTQDKETPVDILEQVKERQNKAKAELLNKGIDEQALNTLWGRFKANYFLRNQPEQIVWHSEAILKHTNTLPLVLISKHIIRGGTELFVYYPDQPKLFSTVAAVLDNKNINVYDAMIMSSKDNYCLDSFIILEQNGKPLTQAWRIQSLHKALIKALTSTTKKLPQFRQLPRKMKPFQVATKVNFLTSNRPNTNMMELIALDAPGLLAKVADILYRCNFIIIAAKITTIGERAEDFFLLQTRDGQALTDNEQQVLGKTICKALSQSN